METLLNISTKAKVLSFGEDLGEVKVYPNPANDKLTIQLDNTMEGKAMVEILDLTGKLIYSSTINADFKLQTIDISKVSKGIYYLRISNNNTTNNQKLVIIK